MKYFDYTMQNPASPHARPASSLTMMAQTWQSEITLEKGEETANPKSLMSVLALSVNQGGATRVIVTDVDEEETIAGMREFMKKNL